MPEMPLPLPVWENTMKCVDKDLSRVKKDLVDRGYRMPEPAALVSGQTPEHHQLFMMNWLAIRPLWISWLDHDPPAQFPIPQLWREILHRAPSKEELEAAPESSMGKRTAKCWKSLGTLWRPWFKGLLSHPLTLWNGVASTFRSLPSPTPFPHHPSDLVGDLRDWLVI